MTETKSVHISNFTVVNYRSCQDTSVHLNPHLSAFIGINGSGKTNVLNALLLIRKVFNWKPWHKIGEKASNRCTLSIAFKVQEKVVRYIANINYNTNERNTEEVLSTDERWNFGDLTGQDEWQSFPSFLIRSKEAQAPYIFAEYAAWQKRVRVHSQEEMRQIKLPEAFMTAPISPALEQISRFVSKINYYSASQYTNPSESPAYFELEEDDVLRRGPYGRGYHAKFLFDLYSYKEKNPSGYEEFLSIVGRQV